MLILPTELPGCFSLTAKFVQDGRGSFTKVFQQTVFSAAGLIDRTTEEYFSVSKQGVFRGFHFQTPPHEHSKLVWCISGEAFDVIVDLRKGSPTFERPIHLSLSPSGTQGVWIPPGCAHGFLALAEGTTMLYRVSTEHSPANDAGIHWGSVRVPWPMTPTVISERDQKFPPLNAFQSPF